MKKTIMATSVLSCLLLSSISSAKDTKPTGLYLKGFYENSIQYHQFNPFTYGAGVGYKFGLFRAEGQYGYGNHSSGQYGYGNHSTARKHTLSLTGYLDFDNRTIFSPYVGLGIGENFYNYTSQNYISVYSENILIPHGTIGTRVYFTQNLALDVGYKANFHSFLNKGNPTIGLAYHF